MENQLLYEFFRNKDESIQISLSEYKQRKYIDLRIFFKPKGEDGFVASKKGITIAVELLPELKKGISLCEKNLMACVEK
ncbi:MAG: transcriptional coactivator p15/PC4 family protein [Candidatus Omnitrophica bacterium]|nr:transcriptional coactivator p15/PC4 family protein [Candidatus Omnitrophota bacterium]